MALVAAIASHSVHQVEFDTRREVAPLHWKESLTDRPYALPRATPARAFDG